MNASPARVIAEPAALGWRLLALVYDLFPLFGIWFACGALALLALPTTRWLTTGLALPPAGLLCRLALPPTGWLSARLLLVPAAWVVLEWWRGWFLTGFPWMSLGYSQTDTFLAGLAPVGGVPLVSFGLLMGAGALLALWEQRGARRAVALVALVLPWTIGLSLRPVEWTESSGAPRSIAIVPPPPGAPV